MPQIPLPKTLAATLAEIVKRGSIEPGVQSKGINLNAISGLVKRGLIKLNKDRRWVPVKTDRSKRKGWDQLSPAYRARLERNGISKKAYGEGESIKAARGHSQTPERPNQAAKFPNYLRERNRLIKIVVDKKYYFFNTAPKWNPRRSMKRFQESPPSIARLKFWAGLSKEEWIDEIRESTETAAYLGYH